MPLCKNTMLLLAACCPLFAGAASFSANTSLVLVPVTVTDRYGKTVMGLRPEHFRVTDNARPREIVSFGRVDAPVSVGVVLDLSASMQRKLPVALAAARAVIDTLSHEDAGYLVTFNKTPQVRVGFTRDVETLGDCLPFSTAEGNTALFDAMGVALHQGRLGKDFRKVLLVISDGGDNRSRLMESDLVSAALEADTQIYCIAVHERLRPREEVMGAQFLERIARLTGGLMFDVRTNVDIRDAVAAFSRAMKEQYVIGFKPPDDAAQGKWNKIRVTVQVPGVRSLRVSAKSAYYEPEIH